MYYQDVHTLVILPRFNIALTLLHTCQCMVVFVRPSIIVDFKVSSRVLASVPPYHFFGRDVSAGYRRHKYGPNLGLLTPDSNGWEGQAPGAVAGTTVTAHNVESVGGDGEPVCVPCCTVGLYAPGAQSHSPFPYQ